MKKSASKLPCRRKPRGGVTLLSSIKKKSQCMVHPAWKWLNSSLTQENFYFLLMIIGQFSWTTIVIKCPVKVAWNDMLSCFVPPTWLTTLCLQNNWSFHCYGVCMIWRSMELVQDPGSVVNTVPLGKTCHQITKSRVISKYQLSSRSEIMWVLLD